MTETEPITDLSQVRWTVERHREWHVIGTWSKPGYEDYTVYDLYVTAGGGDEAEGAFAEQVARKLSEADTTARWQRDRAVEEVNRTRAAMCRAQTALDRNDDSDPSDRDRIAEARAALAAVLRNPS